MTTPTLFTLLPDGANTRAERLVWRTDIQIGRNGDETRTALSARPRLYMSANYLIRGEAKAQLTALKAGGSVYLPLAQHRVEALPGGLAPQPDAIYLSGEGRFLVRNSLGLDRMEQGALTPAVPGWTNGDIFAVPLAEARLTEDSFSVETVANNTVATNLDFLVETIDERVLLALYPPVLAGDGKPVLELRHNWTAAPVEANELSFNRFDEGHLTGAQFRYAKRTVEVQLMLRSRAAICAFRSFCYAVKGRAKAFRFTAPQDTEQRVFRLADDEVVINYYKPRLATVALKLVELAE